MFIPFVGDLIPTTSHVGNRIISLLEQIEMWKVRRYFPYGKSGTESRLRTTQIEPNNSPTDNNHIDNGVPSQRRQLLISPDTKIIDH